MKKLLLLSIALMVIMTACRSAGSDELQALSIAYPDADPAAVTLNARTGTITITPSDVSGISGSATTNVDAWRPRISTSGDAVTIEQGTSSASVIPSASNQWDIRLGADAPLTLTINAGAAHTTADLSGLDLRGLTASATAGRFELRYDRPHPGPDGGSAVLSLASGAVNATGLLNSRLSRLQITTTGGDQTLTFDGEGLAQDMTVTLQTTVGNVLLNIPADLPAQVTYRTTSGRVRELDPQYTQVNEITYASADYAASDGPRLTIEIRTVFGDLRLAGVR